MKRERPASVTLASVFEIVTGAVFLLGGSALLTFAGKRSPILQIFGTIHIPIAIAFVVLGILTIAVARRWVWILAVTLSIISIVDDIVAFAIVPLPYDGVIGTAMVLVTAFIVLSFLGRPDVKSYMKS